MTSVGAQTHERRGDPGLQPGVVGGADPAFHTHTTRTNKLKKAR